MLLLGADSEVGTAVLVPRESPKPPPLVSLRMFPPQAGASPQWDHPGSQEHTCHCAGAQPAAYTGPTVRATTPSSKTENQDHPNSFSKCYDEKKKKKVLFRGSSLHTLWTPSPGDARPATDLSASPARALPDQLWPASPAPLPRAPPSRGTRPTLPAAPVGRSPPGVRLPSFFQFGGGVWGCGGHCRRRRRLHCHRSCRRHRSAARRVAGAGDWGLVRSPEARARGAAGPSRGKLSALGAL